MRFLKNISLSVLAGILLSLSWPEHGIPLIAFIGFVPLLILEEKLTSGLGRQKFLAVFAYAYLSFLIWNLFTTYWVYNSTIEGSIAAFTLNSLFMAAIFMLFSMTKNKLGKSRGQVALIVFWVAFEYLHFDWDLSWPWLTLGNVFASHPEAIQWYEFTGILGGSVWVLWLNINIYNQIHKSGELETRKDKLKLWIRPLLLFVFPLIFSIILYNSQKDDTTAHADVVVVQPNVDPYHEKFDTTLYGDNVFKMINLATVKVDEKTDYVFFPETALPEGVLEHQADSNRNLNVLRLWMKNYPKLNLVTGLNYYRFFDTRAGDEIPSTASLIRGSKTEFYDDYNAALQIDSSQRKQLYFKSKLVPGPEMFPFADYLKPLQDSWFKSLGGMIGDLGTQKERTVFTSPDSSMRVGVIICYESIYGEFVGEYVKNGAEFLAIITNDGWWGDTPGHRQHFQYARLRAVETRRWIARSANTGISGFINARGDIVAQSQYWVTDVMQHEVPLHHEITFYVKYGDYIGRLAVFVSFFILIYAFVRGFLNKRKI